MNESQECKLCNKILKSEKRSSTSLINHLSKYHYIKSKDELKNYYDTYLNKECLKCIVENCQNERTFKSIFNGYRKTCNNKKCQSKIRFPVSIEYWLSRNFSLKESKIKVSEFQTKMSLKYVDKRNKNPEKYNNIMSNQLQWWLDKGYSKDEAKIKLKERQSTFTLEKCINKYGEELGTQKFNERQRKWKSKVFNELTHIGVGKSNISDELWQKLLLKFPTALHGKNEKFIKKTGTNNAYKYDFTLIENKKIIEFNGTFWHCKPGLYESDYFHKVKQMTAKEIWNYDKEKIDLIESRGYKVLTIWEDEYKNNKELTLQKCINFLNE